MEYRVQSTEYGDEKDIGNWNDVMNRRIVWMTVECGDAKLASVYCHRKLNLTNEIKIMIFWYSFCWIKSV